MLKRWSRFRFCSKLAASCLRFLSVSLCLRWERDERACPGFRRVFCVSAPWFPPRSPASDLSDRGKRVEIRAVRFASRRKIIVLIEKRKTRLELKYYKYYIFVVVIFHKNISQFLNETLNEKKRQSLRRTELSALMDRASDRNMIYPDRPWLLLLVGRTRWQRYFLSVTVASWIEHRTRGGVARGTRGWNCWKGA